MCVYFDSRRYSYDPNKRASNRKKHGLDFEDAKEVIESGRTVTFEDNRFEYGERRFVTLGILRGRVVATAETDDEIRVVSMRWATSHEQDIYFRNL